MKCLTDIDALVDTARELWPHPDLVKMLEHIRAQIVLDVAGERLRLIGAVAEVGEPE